MQRPASVTAVAWVIIALAFEAIVSSCNPLTNRTTGE